MSMSYTYVGNTYTMKSSIVIYLTYSRKSLHVYVCPPESIRVNQGGSR